MTQDSPTFEQPSVNPQQFCAKWRDVNFGEKQASQELFLDICRLVGHPTPVEFSDRDAFTFEKRVPGGFADAYLENKFAWEFKGSDAELEGAFAQLLRYRSTSRPRPSSSSPPSARY